MNNLELQLENNKLEIKLRTLSNTSNAYYLVYEIVNQLIFDATPMLSLDRCFELASQHINQLDMEGEDFDVLVNVVAILRLHHEEKDLARELLMLVNLLPNVKRPQNLVLLKSLKQALRLEAGLDKRAK